MIQSRQVEAFRAVMLSGSMTGAAERIGVTQPAVSRLIRDLEREAGMPLFRRLGNQVVPTPQAHVLLEEVERSFVGLQRIADFVGELRSGPSGRLRVATLPAMAAFLPRFVARFSRDRPRLHVVVDSLPSSTVREQVAEGVFDLGVCAAPFRFAGLASTPLDDDAVAVMPAGHALAGQAAVAAGDLRGCDVILLDKFAEGRHPLELALQAVRLGRVFRTPLSTVACAMAAEGAGVAIVDPFAASEFVGRGVALRRFSPATAVGAAVIRSSARRLLPVAQEFHDAFVAHARSYTREAAYLRP